MAFFKPPPPVEEEESDFRYPEPGPWSQPPDLTLPGILPMNRVLAGTSDGVVVLTDIRAYPTGCWLQIRAAVRRPPTQAARRRVWNAVSGMGMLAAEEGGLPPELLRFGVLYSDGTNASSLTRVPMAEQDGRPPPQPPVLFFRPERGGETRERAWIALHMALWLWPLPPAEPFDLILEYPLIGVPETTASLDGAAITAAAAKSRPLINDPN